MPWQYLNATTLAEKPSVLAGPILRRVTADSVTVWFALQRKATIKLTVMDAAGRRIFDGTRATTAVGARLHVVAVTAERRAGEAALTPGAVYLYDAEFTYATGDITNPTAVEGTIAAATRASLGYGTLTKPSFCLPPAEIGSLRILHGSCRKASGAGHDVLAIVDTLIGEHATDAARRPHQLLLTGDQIYADDVAASLLMMLTDAATWLMGWDEGLPGAGPASALPPYSRRTPLDAAGFSSEDLDHHLLSLGEYLCMYLYAWSDVLWPPPDRMPGAEEVLERGLAYLAERLPPMLKYGGGARERALHAHIAGITADVERLTTLRTTLLDVRRALANVPTYMIFDDHEVTDDWNMTENLSAALHGTALGRRVVQNALVAYSLCQHWGNAPEQFRAGDSSLPGTKLLGLLDGQDGTRYGDNAAAIAALVSVPTAEQVRASHRLSHPPGALTYDYVIEGPAHQILVADTRTWRAYPHGGGGGPDLLPADQIARQIANAGMPTGGRLLIGIVSTNAPTLPALRLATELAPVSNAAQHFPDIYESWELPSVAADRLVAALAGRLGFDPVTSAKAVLLSGDVHMGFATRLHYRATTRFEETESPPRPANMVVAQLVASSFKKQTDDTLDYQREGYEYSKHGLHSLVPQKASEYYVGWNVQPSGQRVGIWEGGPLALNRAASVRLPYPATEITAEFTIAPPLGRQLGTLDRPPDFSYQLDYLDMTNGATPQELAQLPVVPPPQTPGALSRDEKLLRAARQRILADNTRLYDRDPAVVRQVIGVNNMGDLTFSIASTSAGTFTVNHRLRFRTPSGGQNFADYTITMESVDPANPASPDYPRANP